MSRRPPLLQVATPGCRCTGNTNILPNPHRHFHQKRLKVEHEFRSKESCSSVHVGLDAMLSLESTSQSGHKGDQYRTEGLAVAFPDDGFVILPELISLQACDELIETISTTAPGKPGSRSLLGLPAVDRTAVELQRQLITMGLMSEAHQVVQCSLFAKGVDATWSVTPHQDLSIPVSDRVEAPGWSGWSRKENVWFVQPPTSILEKLVAVRLQLDDHASETGPLEVVPGSHANGRMTSASVSQHAAHRVSCIVPRGGVLVMRPLLIHSSSKPRSSTPRRVLHYLCGPPLPAGISWATLRR